MNAFSFDTTDSDNIRSTVHGGNLLSTFSNQQLFALSFPFDFTVFFVQKDKSHSVGLKRACDLLSCRWMQNGRQGLLE